MSQRRARYPRGGVIAVPRLKRDSAPAAPMGAAALVATFLLLSPGADAQRSARQSADLEHGEAVFTQWCAPCHSAGPGMPGTQALEAKYGGAVPAVLTERTDLTPEVIGVFVRNGVTVMPFFRKTEISDDDLAALAAYIVASGRAN